jgi:polyhydroxyalkanoate synthesis regulator phasin
MELDGKQYYFTREQNPGSCTGCAFFGDARTCARARELQNCAQEGIIWKRDNGTGEIPKQDTSDLPTAMNKAHVESGEALVRRMKKLRAEATARQSAATAENEAVSSDVRALSEQEKKCLEKYPHYFKDVRHLNILDIYRVLDLFSTGDAALDHAAKKILAAGKRGAKDKTKDIKEAIDALQRKLWMLEEDEKCGQ